MIYSMKRGAYLINTARGKICDAEAVKKACEDTTALGFGRGRGLGESGVTGSPWDILGCIGGLPREALEVRCLVAVSKACP